MVPEERRDEEPHDVLAAEEFAMPTRDPGPAPPDPLGVADPHDVLAAEEFAMPTREQVASPPSPQRNLAAAAIGLAAGSALAALLMRRLRD